MSEDMHHQVAAVLKQAQRLQSLMDDQLTKMNTQTFTATDESETVEVTLNANPLKVREYLATGKPIVMAPLYEYRDTLGIRFYDNADEFIAAVEDALAHDTAEQLTLLAVSDLPVQFRLDQRTRARGLAHIAAIRRQLASKGIAAAITADISTDIPTSIANSSHGGRRHEAA